MLLKQEEKNLEETQSSEAPSMAESTANDTNTRDAVQCPQLNDREIPQSSEVPREVETLAEYAESVMSHSTSGDSDDMDFEANNEKASSFFIFRLSYLFVTLVIMLADGLQGKNKQNEVFF
jgi:hypothetical protein